MVRYTLHQGKNFTGYSIRIDSSSNDVMRPENGYFKFMSLTVGPQTKITIYNDTKVIAEIANGTTSTLKIPDISEYVDVSAVTCRIKSEAFNEPLVHHIKVTSTGKVTTLTTFIKPSSNATTEVFDNTATIIVTLLLFFLFFSVIYAFATRKETNDIRKLLATSNTAL